jgi:hypothetical protein
MRLAARFVRNSLSRIIGRPPTAWYSPRSATIRSGSACWYAHHRRRKRRRATPEPEMR